MNVAPGERADLLPGRGGSSSAPLAARPASRGHDCLLHACRVFNAITGLCALLGALAFGMALGVRGVAAERVRSWGRQGRAGWVWVLGAGHGVSCRRRLVRAAPLAGCCACGTLAALRGSVAGDRQKAAVLPAPCPAPRSASRLTAPHPHPHHTSPYPIAATAQGPYFWSGQAVRAFGIGIALLIVAIETEWPRFLALAPALEAWLGRGVLQVTPAPWGCCAAVLCACGVSGC